MKKLSISLAALLLSSAATTALAQTYGASTGFPIGEKSRVHTNLDLLVAYDSNVERFNNDPPPSDGSDLDDWRGLIRPGLLVDVPGNSVKFNLGSHLTISQLFGATQRASETRFGADIGLSLTLGSDASIVAFKIDNKLVRTPDYIDTAGANASDEFRLPEWNNKGTARITFRPGGRALELDLGYSLEVRAFDSAGGPATQSLGKFQRHGGLLAARWKFLPKTALKFDADVSRFIPFGTGSDITQPGTPFRVQIGAVGQVTSRITAELTAGYEDTLSDTSNLTSRGPIGNAILTYAFNDVTSLTVGYRRRVLPVLVLQGYQSDQPFLNFKIGFAGRVTFNLFGQYEFRNYSDAASSSAQVAIGDARLEYWFFEWLVGSVNYRLTYQSSDAPGAVPIANNFILQDFSRHQIFFGAGFRY